MKNKQVNIFKFVEASPLETLVSSYWANSSPETLFFKGDFFDKQPHEMGLLHRFELPFYLGGLIMLFLHILKTGFRRGSLFVLLLLGVGFLPAALSVPTPLALRSLSVLPATSFISALGISTVINWFHRGARLVIISVLSFGLVLSERDFLTTYHNGYVVTAGERVWQVSKKEALLYVRDQESFYDEVYLTPDIRDINAAWYLKYDPYNYQQRIFISLGGKSHTFVRGKDEISQTESKKLYVSTEKLQQRKLLYATTSSPGSLYMIWEL